MLPNDNTYNYRSTNTEDYIIFEEISAKNNQWQGKSDTYSSQQSKYPSPIPGKYNSLYEEIRIKCNPANFMSRYNPELLNTVHELYIQAEQHKDDIAALKALRSVITQELGIVFSTESLFYELKEALNPTNFNGDHRKFTEANLLYNKTLLCADNIDFLESIKEEAKKKDLYKSFIETPPEELDPYAFISTIIVYILVAFLGIFFIVKFFSK